MYSFIYLYFDNLYFTSHLSRYLLPIYPFIAILSANSISFCLVGFNKHSDEGIHYKSASQYQGPQILLLELF